MDDIHTMNGITVTQLVGMQHHCTQTISHVQASHDYHPQTQPDIEETVPANKIQA